MAAAMGDGMRGVQIGILILWLISLPFGTACRVRVWQSDQTLDAAASRVPPVSRRTWGRLERWDQLILIDEQPPLRQPFSSRERPR